MIDLDTEPKDDPILDDFDVEENEDGSATIVPKATDAPEETPEDFYTNLADGVLSEATKKTLAADYLAFVEEDKKAREKRDKQYAEAIQRSGLGDDAPGGAEFQGASKVVHPIIAESAIDFAARTAKELLPADGPVKTKLDGKVTKEVMQKAERIKAKMNDQLMRQIVEFRPSLEQILTQVPMGGVQYSKMYWWERGKRPKFEFIPLDDVFVPFNAPNFYSAVRKTHEQKLNRIEFDDRVASGLYIDPEQEYISDDGDEPSAPALANEKVEGKQDPGESALYDDDDLRKVYEIYCWLELEDDKQVKGDYKFAPYILTIDEPTEKVLAVYRNWKADDVTMQAMEWMVEWPFIPWRGAYALGLSQLIGGLSAAATGALRALMDSAHINNAPTAMKLKGAKMGGQSATISVTQIHEIDAGVGTDDIRKIAMPLPFNPPSSVLFNLLGFLVETGKGVVRTAMDNMSSDNPNTPVGTELSRVEQGLVVFSSIHARLHEAMRKTLEILYRLNAEHLPDEGDEDEATRADFEGKMNVQPVSDPNIFSDTQRFAQIQSVMQLAEKYPQLYDARAINMRALSMMKVPGIEELMPAPPKAEDENPATENIKMAMGTPAFAMPDQDHLAHLQVLCDFYSSPALGQNPAIKPKFAPQFVQHATQHILFLYGTEIKTLIEQASGQPIASLMGDEPEVTEALSKAVAAASPAALKQIDGTPQLDAMGQPVIDPQTQQPVTQPGLLGKVLLMIQEASQYVQSITPPPPQDPSQVAAQAAQQQAQVQSKKVDSETQTKREKIQSDQEIAQLKSQTEMNKNEEDNKTALMLAQMRIESGEGVGGLKNGNSLGMADGGLVTTEGVTDEEARPHQEISITPAQETGAGNETDPGSQTV